MPGKADWETKNVEQPSGFPTRILQGELTALPRLLAGREGLAAPSQEPQPLVALRASLTHPQFFLLSSVSFFYKICPSPSTRSEYGDISSGDVGRAPCSRSHPSNCPRCPFLHPLLCRRLRIPVSRDASSAGARRRRRLSPRRVAGPRRCRCRRCRVGAVSAGRSAATLASSSSSLSSTTKHSEAAPRPTAAMCLLSSLILHAKQIYRLYRQP